MGILLVHYDEARTQLPNGQVAVIEVEGNPDIR